MKKKVILPLLGYFIGWLYWKTMLEEWPILLFVAAFLAWGTAMGGEKQPKGKMHAFWGAMTMLIGLAITLKRCNAALGWSLLALHGAAVLWALSFLGADRGGEDALDFGWDCLDGFLLLPFSNFFGRIQDTIAGFSNRPKPISTEAEKKKKREFWLVLLCLVAALPLLGLVTNLLGQADAGFENLVRGFQIQLSFSENFWEELFLFALGLPVGAYLYGLLRGAALRQQTPRLSEERQQKIRVLPAVGVNLVLGLFAAVYFLFFGVQAGNLFAVFSGHVPGTLTAASYARTGFFQLCAVMAINFGLIWLLSLLVKESRAGKWLSGLLMVQSIFLAVLCDRKLYRTVLLLRNGGCRLAELR